VQGLAAEFLRTAQDHRVPERRPGSLVDVDGREDGTSSGSVDVPVRQIVDDPRGGRGVERLGDLPRRGDEELLQHLNAQAALPRIPQFLDQGAAGGGGPVAFDPPVPRYVPFILPPILLLFRVLRLTGVKPNLAPHGGLPHSEEELRALLAQAIASGSIPTGRAHLLSSAFEFHELKVRQIMVPRTRVDYLLAGQPIGDVLKTVQNAGYTRYPLCKGDIDHVIGLVHMKDLFMHLKLVPGKLRFVDETSADREAVAILGQRERLDLLGRNALEGTACVRHKSRAYFLRLSLLRF